MLLHPALNFLRPADEQKHTAGTSRRRRHLREAPGCISESGVEFSRKVTQLNCVV